MWADAGLPAAQDCRGEARDARGDLGELRRSRTRCAMFSASGRASICRCAPPSAARKQRRTYSICSAPGEPNLRIAIKRVAEGRFSNWANDTLAAGEAPGSDAARRPLRAARERRWHARRVVAFAAGAGITPIIAMLKHALAQEPLTSLTLVYGNRAPESIIFRGGAGGPEGPPPRPPHADQRALPQRGEQCAAAGGPHHRREGQGTGPDTAQGRRRGARFRVRAGLDDQDVRNTLL